MFLSQYSINRQSRFGLTVCRKKGCPEKRHPAVLLPLERLFGLDKMSTPTLLRQNVPLKTVNGFLECIRNSITS